MLKIYGKIVPRWVIRSCAQAAVSPRTELGLPLPSTITTSSDPARRKQWGQGGAWSSLLTTLHTPVRPRTSHATGETTHTTCLVRPVLGEHFQPQGIKQDRTGGMAKLWQTLCPAPPLHPTLQHLPGGSAASCSPGRFFAATMAQALVPGRCQAHPGLKLPPLLSEGIKTPETLGWWWGTGGCQRVMSGCAALPVWHRCPSPQMPLAQLCTNSFSGLAWFYRLP